MTPVNTDAVLEQNATKSARSSARSSVSYKLRLGPDTIVAENPADTNAEQFRRLRSQLSSERVAPTNVIALTSAVAGEGKSLVAFNLALAFATNPNTRTVIVDADLRKAGGAQLVTPDPERGLTDVVEGRLSLEQAIIHPTNSRLAVLPPGTEADDPAILIASDRCRALFDELRRMFDRVIIDTPPLLPFNDATTLSSYSDGLVLVVRADLTRQAHLDELFDMVSEHRVLGTVLNGLSRNVNDWSLSVDDYYKNYYGRSGNRKKTEKE